MAMIFKNIEERSTYNSTAFMEIQLYKLSDKSTVKKRFGANDIKHWASDSLYVYHLDVDKFLAEYGEIFVNGEYANHKTGFIDPYGVTYFPKEQIKDYIHRILISKPIDYEIMLEWLNEALKYNGIYILGL
jgi:hypothetical protein